MCVEEICSFAILNIPYLFNWNRIDTKHFTGEVKVKEIMFKTQLANVLVESLASPTLCVSVPFTLRGSASEIIQLSACE